MDDLRAAGVDLLTLGQYLRPTSNHLPVERFVTPAEFDTTARPRWRTGFLECVAGPLVRSSYRAEQALAGNNAGLGSGGLASHVSCRRATGIAAVTPAPILRWLGRVEYEPTWRAMQRVTDARDADDARRDLVPRASAGVHAGHERAIASTCSRPATSRWCKSIAAAR